MFVTPFFPLWHISSAIKKLIEENYIYISVYSFSDS